MSTFSASDAPFEYTFESSEEETGAVLTRYLGSENASGEPERILTVPAQIDGFPVLAVGEGAFSENGGALEEIRVPGTVRSIRENAFEYCFSLRTLILKNGVEHLGANFIGSCPQMTSLALPASIHRIDRPGDLGSLRLLPAEGNASYQYDGYGLYRTMSSDTAPAPCASVLITVSQQDDRTEYRVAPGTVCIGANAFAGQSHLRRVILPDSLREIGPSAFCQCQSLSNVVFSEGLLSIGDEAFSACPSLKSLSLPASLCEIGRCALDTSGWDDREDGLREITLRHVPQPDTNTPRQTPQPGTNTPQQTPPPGMNTPRQTSQPGMNTPSPAHLRAALPLPLRVEQQALYAGTELVKYFGSAPSFTVPAFVTRVRERAFRRAALRSLCFYDNQVFFEGDALKECASLEELTILDNKGDDKERNSKNRDNKKEPGTSLLCTLYIPPLAYRKEEFCRLLYCGPFDFAGYDALFPTYYTEPYDMMRMACCRLLHPVSLPQRQEQEYRGYLERNAIQLLSAIAKKDDPDALQTLLSLSVLSPEELDEGIELLNRLRKPILLQLLMQYKYEHGREQSFSYEL